MKIRKVISYIYPLVLESRRGEFNNYLEVVKYKGILQLNSANANYSFGGLNTIVQNLFKEISLENYDFKSALILGLGAGNVVEVLRNKYDKQMKITGIEADSEVINLSKKYFNIDKFDDLEIVHTDAFNYVKYCRAKYDLIFIDLFIDDEVPKKFHSLEFLESLEKIANKNCVILFNKMTHRQRLKDESKKLKEDFKTIFNNVSVIKTIVNGSENSVLFYDSFPKLELAV